MTSSKKRISGKKNKSIYRFYLCTLLVLLAVFVSCAKKEVISSQKDDEGPFVIDCSTLVSIKNESKNTISGAIAIPSIVTWIDDYAFSDCTSLTAINIPSSVIYVGESVFKGCTGLSYISVDVENSKYTSNGKMLLSKDKTRLISYPSASGSFPRSGIGATAQFPTPFGWLPAI